MKCSFSHMLFCFCQESNLSQMNVISTYAATKAVSALWIVSGVRKPSVVWIMEVVNLLPTNKHRFCITSCCNNPPLVSIIEIGSAGLCIMVKKNRVCIFVEYSEEQLFWDIWDIWFDIIVNKFTIACLIEIYYRIVYGLVPHWPC